MAFFMESLVLSGLLLKLKPVLFNYLSQFGIFFV